MIALFTAVLGAAILGSLHCAGMCGGLVGFYAGAPGRPTALGRLAAHLAYNTGRLLAYAGLGAAAGAIGAAADVTGDWMLGVQRSAAVLSGILITLWGLVSLLDALGARSIPLGPPPGLRTIAARGVRAVANAPAVPRALAVGLLTGGLPCGWLYAFVVTAAGTGAATTGAAVMAVFWAGTVPMMLGVGLGIQALSAPLRRHVPVACAVAMIVVGFLAIGGRLRPPDGRAGHTRHAMERSEMTHDQQAPRGQLDTAPAAVERGSRTR